jgi:hypothetical protein
MSDWEYSDEYCPKCNSQLAERRCDLLGCEDGEIDLDGLTGECDECSGSGWLVWCRECGFDVTNQEFLSPQYEAEFLARGK